MKVRLSQIKEENGKPMYTRTHSAKKPKKGLIEDIDEEDEEESEGGEMYEEEEKKSLSKTVIRFKGENIIISAYDLHTIETDMRFVEKPKAHWEFGIVINKGLNPGQFVNKTDLSMWFQREEVRDKRFEEMVKTLTEEGLNVIEV